jgi:hypothetical protein
MLSSLARFLCCKTDMLVLALYANGLGSNPFYSKKSTEW